MDIVEGIITRSQNFKDRDRLVTVFTPENGVMRGIVKGVGRKKMAATTPGTCVEYVVKTGKTGLFSCHTATVKHAFLGIRKSKAHIDAAIGMLQLINETQHEQTPSDALYTLLTAYLTALEKTSHPLTLLESFTLKLHFHDGHLPENLSSREQHLVSAKSFSELESI